MTIITIPDFTTHDIGGYNFLQGSLPEDLLWDDAAFEEVWRLHPDDKPRIKMHGKEVAIPRWQQAYGADYHFSGQTSRALPTPTALVPLLDWARRAINADLSGLLLNWYDGPGHYIGPHHDSVKGMVKDAPIVTISFGETRVFRLTPGKKASGIRRDFPAPTGTVFVMPYDTNLAWKHQVVKSARYRGRRVSVTLRAFTAELSDS
jgi:alkylated DNA repair dioxygenase AlkB